MTGNIYQVGQKVMVRPDLELNKRYDTTGCREWVSANEKKYALRGQIATIKSILNGYVNFYKLDICDNPGGDLFTDTMLMPIAQNEHELLELLVKGYISESDYEKLKKELK